MKIATVVSSVLLSIGVIAVGTSILLPSTKRARFEFQGRHENPQDPALTQPTTRPASQP